MRGGLTLPENAHVLEACQVAPGGNRGTHAGCDFGQLATRQGARKAGLRLLGNDLSRELVCADRADP